MTEMGDRSLSVVERQDFDLTGELLAVVDTHSPIPSAERWGRESTVYFISFIFSKYAIESDFVAGVALVYYPGQSSCTCVYASYLLS
jgi:hypothetical protein